MNVRVAGLAVLLTLFVTLAFGQEPITIHLAGDSTMAPKAEQARPETGWGEAFAALVDADRYRIDNRAVNGRSTWSFIDEGRWQALLDATNPGDWVFIQFGHNDQKFNSDDPYEPEAGYRRNLERFVADVRARDAMPVLLTPVMRRRFDENDQFYDTHGGYPDIVRQVAAQHDVDLIDMHAQTGQLIRGRGPEASRKLFLMLAPGEHPNYPSGIEDNTHFSPAGARTVAEFAAASFRRIAEQRAAVSEASSLIVDIDRQPDVVMPLWPAGAPGGENLEFEEILESRANPQGLTDRAVRNTVRPTLSVFYADAPNGSALLVIPGGGYNYVVVEKEGWEVARWFNRRGVTAYVMTYRLPQQRWAAGPDTPLQDAQRAIRLIRARADADGVDPARVLVMGFSAGGHVAGSLATRFAETVYARVDAADDLPARPDAAALIYPVVTMDEQYTHMGSRTNLLGASPRRAVIERYSVEHDPPADTPPVFLLHANDDGAVPVENSLALHRALQNRNIPVVMHLFDSGGHGFGLRGLEGHPLRVWPQLVLDFGESLYTRQ
jgi:acetyl esterase/lipase